MGNDFCCDPPPMSERKSKTLNGDKESINFEKPTDDPAEIEKLLRSTVVEPDKRYNLEDFVKRGILGEGGFATVFVVELKQNIKVGIKKEFAMKQIGKKKLHERRVINNLVLQKKVLAEVKNKFIIELSFAFQDKANCYFVMEYATGGDVYSFLNNPKQHEKVLMYKACGEAAPKFILACVILGLECLHRQNIMYRDLKPENVLIFENGYPKLTDFGLAKKNQGQEITRTMAGTKIYFCPQILEKKGHNRFVDFWTLGVFLHELILYVPPFDSSSIVPGKFSQVCLAAQKNRDWKSGKISQSAKSLINGFLKVDPQQRLGVKGFDQIKNHLFFKDFDWEGLAAQRLKSPLQQVAKKYPHRPKEIQPSKHDDSMKEEFPQIDGLTYKQPKLG